MIELTESPLLLQKQDSPTVLTDKARGLARLAVSMAFLNQRRGVRVLGLPYPHYRGTICSEAISSWVLRSLERQSVRLSAFLSRNQLRPLR